MHYHFEEGHELQKALENAMTFEEAKQFLGVSCDFLYKRLQNGVITGYKFAGRWVIYQSDLQKYLSQLPNNKKKIIRKCY